MKRFNPWQLLLTAFVTTSIRLFLYGIMPNASWVIPISLMHSFTFGVYWIATVAYVDQMSSDEIKSSAQGMLYAVLNLSRMSAALVIGGLYDLIGASDLFKISALFSIFAVALFWLNKPRVQKAESLGGSL